jgi:hypothetical protein
MDDPVEALADMAQHLQPHVPILILDINGPPQGNRIKFL